MVKNGFFAEKMSLTDIAFTFSVDIQELIHIWDLKKEVKRNQELAELILKSNDTTFEEYSPFYIKRRIMSSSSIACVT